MNENKIKNTKVGDDIHFFVNGSEDRGIVVKMNNEYVTVFKESTQNYDDIHINDTFFIKDILINKEWDKMEDVERFELLKSIHAPTPRFLSKSWDQLPKEIKTLLVKNNGIETSHNNDEDPMNVTARVFDETKLPPKTETSPTNKTLNQTSRGKPKQRTRGGVKTTVGDDKDAGIKEEPKGFSRSGEKQEGLTHNVANFDEFKTIEEEKLGEGSKGDKNVTGMNFMEEGGDKIGVGASLSGQDRATEQEIKFGKQQGRRDQGKKDDDVTAGVSALKAWQLWLAEREQQVLKEEKSGKEALRDMYNADPKHHRVGAASDDKDPDKIVKDIKRSAEKLELLKDSLSGDARIYDDRSDNALPADSPQSHSEASTAAKHPERKQGTYNANIDHEETRREVRQNPRRPDYATEESQNTGAPAGEKIEDKVEASMRSDDEPANMLSDSDYHLQRAAIPKGGKAPKDIKRSISEMMEELKSSVETSIHGNAARNPNSGVNTNTPFDASNDYEGFSHDGIRLEQFKHEKKKPNVGKEKVNINIDGKEKPADSAQGGNKSNEYGTPTENPTDKKGRIVSEKDKK